jgi:hypothetical protein
VLHQKELSSLCDKKITSPEVLIEDFGEKQSHSILKGVGRPSSSVAEQSSYDEQKPKDTATVEDSDFSSIICSP